jgi:hypothetical protein
LKKFLGDSVREKTSASNERICKKEKGEFLIAQIAQGLPMITLLAISFPSPPPLDSMIDSKYSYDSPSMMMQTKQLKTDLKCFAFGFAESHSSFHT